MYNIYPIFKYILIQDVQKIVEIYLKSIPKMKRTSYQNMFIKLNKKKRSKIIIKLLIEMGCIFKK